MRALSRKGVETWTFLSVCLSLLGRRKPFRRRRRYSRSGAPVFGPYTSFALSESSKDTIGDPREQWVKKNRLPSFSEFFGRKCSASEPHELTWWGVVPAAQSTGRRIRVHKNRLIVSMYTKVEKYGLVFSSFRERKLTAAAYHPPEGSNVRCTHFFRHRARCIVRISKSSRLVAPGVDWRTVLALFL